MTFVCRAKKGCTTLTEKNDNDGMIFFLVRLKTVCLGEKRVGRSEIVFFYYFFFYFNKTATAYLDFVHFVCLALELGLYLSNTITMEMSLLTICDYMEQIP